MSDYTQVTDFSAKDALTTGDPEKAISGADVDGELALISTAIATKFDGNVPFASPKDAPYNAAGDGSTDDTAAVQACLDANDSIYLAEFYKLTDKITVATGKTIVGTHRTKSGFLVESDFTMAATAIVEFTGGESGPRLENIGIYCTQDSTQSTRAGLNQYPTAIGALACPRFQIIGCRIQGALTGIDTTGNSGGFHIQDLECGVLTTGIIISGAKDFCFLDGIEFWPFDYASGNIYTAIYSDGTTIGLNIIGECDGLTVGTMSAFRVRTVLGSAGFGSIASINCDGRYSRLEIGAGNWNIGTMYSTTDAADDYAIIGTSANNRTIIGTAHISTNTDLTGSNGLIQYTATATSSMTIGALYAKLAAACPGTAIVHQTNGALSIGGGYCEIPEDTTYTADIFDIDGGKFSLSNMRVRDKGTGTGNLLGVAAEGRHNINNVTAPGWPVSLPTDTENMILSGNTWDTDTAGSRDLNPVQWHKFTGNLSGGGATVAHGLAAAHQAYPVIFAHEVSGATRTPLTITSIDATNVIIAGGTGTSVYELIVGFGKNT